MGTPGVAFKRTVSWLPGAGTFGIGDTETLGGSPEAKGTAGFGGSVTRIGPGTGPDGGGTGEFSDMGNRSIWPLVSPVRPRCQMGSAGLSGFPKKTEPTSFNKNETGSQFSIATNSQKTQTLIVPAIPLNLCSAKCGIRLRIVSINSSCIECQRLRELGFSESTEVCKIAQGAAIICSLYGTRLAIGKSLGKLVLVEPVAA